MRNDQFRIKIMSSLLKSLFPKMILPCAICVWLWIITSLFVWLSWSGCVCC